VAWIQQLKSRASTLVACDHGTPALPRTVSPAPDETLSSYLGRLARANSMRHWEFDRYVRASRRISDPFPPEAVITRSGQDPGSVRYAILELCTPAELSSWVARVPPRRSRRLSRDRTRCPRCPASRGTTRCRHRRAAVARVPRPAGSAVRIRPPGRLGVLHPRARCRPVRQGAPGS
jgi:hypothetical protein